MKGRTNTKRIVFTYVCHCGGSDKNIARINKQGDRGAKYELLYDKSHRQYKNRMLTDQTWASIASEMGIERELCVWLRNCSLIVL